MSETAVRTFLFQIPGEAFGDEICGVDPKSALESYYGEGMCGGSNEIETPPFNVSVVEILEGAEETVRDELNMADGCEGLADAMDDFMSSNPHAPSWEFVVHMDAEGVRAVAMD
jgi:hypothetical protein